MKRNLSFALSLLSIVFALSACATPLTYSAKEIHGQIVDAETDQPIEGAVIVAQWILFQMGIGHGGHKGRIHIHETVTDQNGHYTIPAWGPKLHSPFTELDREDPQILIFKSGYEPRSLYNSVDRSDSVRVSEWDGKVVKLKKPIADIEKQAFFLSSFYGGLERGDYRDWCNYPRMLLAVYAEKRRLQSLGLKPGHAGSVPDIGNFSESDRLYLKRFEK